MTFKFNKEQMQAVEHDCGPCLVIAGPGSGKTAVITGRLQYLINQKKVPPGCILVITFSKASAQEMQTRFQKETNSELSSSVTFGTFHAVFFHIIKKAYHYTYQNIITEKEKVNFIRDAIFQVSKEETDLEYELNLLKEISSFKNTSRNSDEFLNNGMDVKEFQLIYKLYQKRLNTEEKLDFDDMMLKCDEYLSTHREALEYWQQKYRYLLIDEFQDCNKLQYKLATMLAGEAGNLFAVGDDDQSIYGFRGSDPEIMKLFQKDHPKAKEIILSTNYRSNTNIVHTADLVIRENRNRIMKSPGAVLEEPIPVLIRGYSNLEEEVACLKASMEKAKGTGALLCRTNKELTYFVSIFEKTTLPINWKQRKTENLYETEVAKDVYAYFLLATGNRKRSLLLQILNKPQRFIDRTVFDSETLDFDALMKEKCFRPEVQKELQKLLTGLQKMKWMTPYLAITYLTNYLQYQEYLRSKSFKNEKETDAFAILKKLLEESKSFSTLEEWIQAVEKNKCGNENRIMESTKSLQTQAGIQLITMHGSKGLEYDHVWIPNIKDGTIPYGKQLDTKTLEEERRIFYVALTRARHQLELFYEIREEEPLFLQPILHPHLPLQAHQIHIHPDTRQMHQMQFHIPHHL